MTHHVRKPTEAERRLIRRILSGRAGAFSQRRAQRPVIRAHVVRRLMLSDRARRAGRGPDSVVIENAEIVGLLDLRDAACADGAPLPGLVLRNCTIRDGIDLTNVHIRRIDLTDSALPLLAARHVRVDAEVVLEGVHPVHRHCRVDMHGAQLPGGLVAARARLRSPVRPRRDRTARDRIYALDLSSALLGTVHLQPGFEARGGVDLQSSELRGDLWAEGALLTSGENVALAAAGMRVANIMLRAGLDESGRPRPFLVRGSIDFFGAHIGGALDLSGASMEGPFDRSAEPVDACVPVFDPEEEVVPDMAAQLRLDTAVVDGPIFLSQRATSARAGTDHGDAIFRLTSEGYVAARQARIRATIYFTGARIASGVLLTDSHIGGDLLFQNIGAAHFSTRDIALDQTRIDGSLHVAGVIGSGFPDTVFSAQGMRVLGSASFSGPVFHGPVSLRHAQVEQELTLVGARVRGSFDAQRLRVGGSLRMEAVLLGGSCDIRQAHVTGNFTLDSVALRGGDWKDPPSISMQDAQIGGELAIRSLRAVGDHAPVSSGHGEFLAMRRRRLSCYPGWQLIEGVAALRTVLQIADPGTELPPGPAAVAFLARDDGRDAVLLTGNSDVFHELNETGALVLENERQAEDYLRIFTSYVWGDEGSFRVIDPHEDILSRLADPESASITPIEVRRADGRFRATGTVLYGTGLFAADFDIGPDGMVEMLDDRPIGAISKPDEICISPFRFGRRATGASFPQSVAQDQWEDVEDPERTRIAALLQSRLTPPPTVVSLQDARADRLDDDDGRAWSGRFRLQLDGFTYARAPRRTSAEGIAPRARRRLLGLQLEERLERATRMRRRRLAAYPGWWIVEAIAPLNLSASGDDLGFDRFVPGVVTFLWRDAEASDTTLNRNGLPPGLLLLSGDRGRVTQPRFPDALLGPPRIDSDSARLDMMRVGLWSTRRGRAPVTILEPGPWADANGIAARPVEIEHDGADFIARFTVLVADEESALSQDTEIRVRPGPVFSDSVELDEEHPHALRVRHVGPFRLADADDPFASSPWGNDGWEAVPGNVPERRAMLATLAPVVRAFLAPSVQNAAEGDPPLPAAAAAQSPRTRRRIFPKLLPAPDERVEARMKWLALQYDDGRITNDDYRPHPYEVLATAFRNEGADRNARKILTRKLDIETAIEPHPMRRLFNRLFGLCFGYGLSPLRALAGTLIFWLAGVATTSWLDSAGLLVVDFTPAATIGVPATAGDDETTAPVELGVVEFPSGETRTRVRCGDNISRWIYPADLMIPVLDFGQERRCQIAGTRPAQAGFWLEPWIWKIGQALYTAVGALFVSIALLTVSGVLRRRAES